MIQWWETSFDYKIVAMLVFYLFICGSITASSLGCILREPLGIANGRIPFSNISSSSSYGSKWGPSQARLNTASSWCGGANGTWLSDWIQVDFGDTVNITGIAIQGNYDNAADLVLGFYLQLSEDGISFMNHSDSSGKLLEQEISVGSRNRIHYFWFSSVSAKRLRIRATKLFLSGSMARFCLRFELFGCNYHKPDFSHYSVGLENGIIPDSQLTSSASLIGQPPFHARLNIPNSWCVSAQTDEWLQIDLGLVLAVSAIATQGSYGRNSNDLVSSFLLSYSNHSQSLFTFIKNGAQNKTFPANHQTSEDPVFNNIDPIILAKYIRIHPVNGSAGSNKLCLRAEVYAKHPESSTVLTAKEDTLFSSVDSGRSITINRNIDMYSPNAWCASYGFASEVLQIDFGIIRLVSGIAITGNSEADNWVTSFSVKFGFDVSNLQSMNQQFKGTNGRTETAINWLKDSKLMRVLQVIPIEFVGNKCLRIRVIGCENIPITGVPPQLTEAASSTASVSFKIQHTNQTSSTISAVMIEYKCISGAHPCLTTKPVQKVFSDFTSGQRIQLKGLLPWTKYEFTSRFLFNASWTNKSNTIVATTFQTAPGNAPSGCQISKITTDSMFISWQRFPANFSNGSIISYNISYYIKASKTKITFITVNSTITNKTIQNLIPSTAYVVLISAISEAGSGPFCQIEAQTLTREVTRKPFLRPSELALIIVTAGVMLIFLVVIFLEVCVAKNAVSRRRKKYKKYLKTIQFLALVESTKKEKKSEPDVKVDQTKAAGKRGSDGHIRHGRVLPQPPPVVKIDQTTNTEDENATNATSFDGNLVDTPRN